jgi:hypothetical protein
MTLKGLILTLVCGTALALGAVAPAHAGTFLYQFTGPSTFPVDHATYDATYEGIDLAERNAVNVRVSATDLAVSDAGALLFLPRLPDALLEPGLHTFTKCTVNPFLKAARCDRTPGVPLLGIDVFLGAGHDRAFVFGVSQNGIGARLVGGEGNDLLVGGPGQDVFEGGNGSDQINGAGGGDIYDGGDGNDTINSRDANGENVVCGPGSDIANVDALDTTVGCEVVNVM